MSQSRPVTHGNLKVLLLAASVVLAVVALLAVSAAPVVAAQDGQSKQSDQKQPAAKKPAVKAAPQAGGGGQRAFIDPKTGKLREAEPGEAEALQPLKLKTRKALAAPAPRMLSGPGGAVGMVVPEEAMSYSVATVNPDGTVSMACVTGKTKAEAIVKSPAKATKATKKEEHNHDR